MSQHITRNDVVAKLVGSALTESNSVALAAVAQIGRQYKITRELTNEFVDCSTVVSQAHWEGAAISTPFIADSQRLAASGTSISSWENILPGDALITYPSRRDSPGGRHNHVVLALSSGTDYPRYAIESREDRGARFLLLDDAAWAGGIKRFCLNPNEVFSVGLWSLLAQRVPKLGRPGSRLTSNPAGPRHLGVDIVAAFGWEIVSPIAGEVTEIVLTDRWTKSYALTISDDERMVALRSMRLSRQFRVGEAVAQGETIGHCLTTSARTGCNTVHANRGRPVLHWELWSSVNQGSWPYDAREVDGLRRSGGAVTWHAYNPLYSLKLGRVGPPVRLHDA